MPDPRIERACSRWQLTLDERATSNANNVWFARRNGAHVVLKVGDVESRRREAEALAAYTWPHASALLEHDGEGALLVERVLLGDDIVPIAETDDDAATAVIGTLITTLHAAQTVPPSGALPLLRELSEVFMVKPDSRLDHSLVSRAAALFDELTQSGDAVVLHGDLHHANVVRRGSGDSADQWVAIDPHGWWGDPAFDTASMAASPRGLTLGTRDGRVTGGPRERALRRASILAEATGFSRDRVIAWSFVGAVIAELWMLDDHDLVHGSPLALAQSLRDDV